MSIGGICIKDVHVQLLKIKGIQGNGEFKKSINDELGQRMGRINQGMKGAEKGGKVTEY